MNQDQTNHRRLVFEAGGFETHQRRVSSQKRPLSRTNPHSCLPDDGRSAPVDPPSIEIMVEVKAPKSKSSILPSWFRQDDGDKLRWFALWLLVWNCAAGADALAFTFTPGANLDNYYGEGRWTT
ncbi:hypothetical protein THAOC_14415 [Thalassiosira oceanica]|uniref:Uncharacterized protein n=1 Tax=Thalassiosira oceanica TaxID=159749 RepID=K0T308_THAOC|nr:hypothetical protein THAOC_14415 [Thalassiosira oceanica]|eukprot:EJK64812.1 hypothetical protein THAOC_14415 [Thalassiosira oceanica]